MGKTTLLTITGHPGKYDPEVWQRPVTMGKYFVDYDLCVVWGVKNNVHATVEYFLWVGFSYQLLDSFNSTHVKV